MGVGAQGHVGLVATLRQGRRYAVRGGVYRECALLRNLGGGKLARLRRDGAMGRLCAGYAQSDAGLQTASATRSHRSSEAGANLRSGEREAFGANDRDRKSTRLNSS